MDLCVLRMYSGKLRNVNAIRIACIWLANEIQKTACAVTERMNVRVCVCAPTNPTSSTMNLLIRITLWITNTLMRYLNVIHLFPVNRRCMPLTFIVRELNVSLGSAIVPWRTGLWQRVGSAEFRMCVFVRWNRLWSWIQCSQCVVHQCYECEHFADELGFLFQLQVDSIAGFVGNNE